MRNLCVGLLLVGMAVAGVADFRDARLVDVAPAKIAGPGIVAGTTVIPINYDAFTLTVAIDQMAYSATYYQRGGFKSGQFIVGDSISAAINGDWLIVKDQKGKERKAKITRRERLPN